MTWIKKVVIAVLVILVLVAGYYLYGLIDRRPVGSESVLATEAPAVKREPTKPITIKAPVKAYQGKTKARLKLPASVQADDRQQVIAASQVPANLRPQTVSTVINTDTGAVETFVKTDPYPWFAIEQRGEVKVAYGYKYQHSIGATVPVVRLHAAYDVVRVKALTLGVIGTVDSDRDAFVGIGVSYKW